jgi:hypothetical protein
MSEKESWEDLTDEDFVVTKETNQSSPPQPTTIHTISPSTLNRGNDDDWLRNVHPYFESQPKVTLLKREVSSPGKQDSKTPSNPPTTPKIQTFEEKMKNYAQARAQIFSQK